ncbi:MAG: hypothetical protein PVG85_00975 [Deltaproteobacteria bacterium]|jgi:Ca2+-binding EF-hand superfamily protein
MRKLGIVVLILLGAVTLLGINDTFAKGPCGHDCMKAHFDAMDTDQDGKISGKEHAAWSETVFKGKDIDKDGFLTKEEIQKGYPGHKQTMKQGHVQGHTGAPPCGGSPAED